MRNIRTQGNLAVRKNKIRMRRSAKQRLELLGQVETHSRIATHLLAAEPPHQQTQGGRKKKEGQSRGRRDENENDSFLFSMIIFKILSTFKAK